jgi:hypothetical protein
MHLIHRMSNYFCQASAPHGNYDPAVTILSRISLALSCRGTDHYAGMVPAYLVLVCGVLGNMTDDDVRRTIGYCAQLYAHGGTVVWTRGRREPDLVPQICDWFAGRGFEPLWVSDPAEGWGVGAYRFAATPVPLERGARMFTFAYHPDTGPARHRAQRYSSRTGRTACPGPATCLRWRQPGLARAAGRRPTRRSGCAR